MDDMQLKYLPTHEWIEPSGTTRKVGISQFAQEQLGDIVFVEFPPVGKQFKAGDEVAVIESCKATSAVYAPLGGTITAVNDRLGAEPGLINSSPYDEGWLFELTVAADVDDAALLDPTDYARYCTEGE